MTLFVLFCEEKKQVGAQCTMYVHVYTRTHAWDGALTYSLALNVIDGSSSRKKRSRLKIDLAMLRTFTILMLGLFQADASIWFVNYEKYILGFQSFGVILTFIISSHIQ